ncbi:hypothetical protein ACHAXM_001510 [Skeletonema potamos]|jgi:hypothetical protein
MVTQSYETAVRRGTVHLLGQWFCSRCGESSILKVINSKCHRNRCDGRVGEIETKSVGRIKAFGYALAPNCPNVDEKCIGPVGQHSQCKCNRLVGKNNIDYTDGYDMSTRIRAPKTQNFYSYENGVLVNGFGTITELCREIRPLLITLLDNGFDWFERNDLLWALKRAGRSRRVIGHNDERRVEILSESRLHKSLTAVIKTNPHYNLVIGRTEYRMVKWTTRNS